MVLLLLLHVAARRRHLIRLWRRGQEAGLWCLLLLPLLYVINATIVTETILRSPRRSTIVHVLSRQLRRRHACSIGTAVVVDPIPMSQGSTAAAHTRVMRSDS